MVMEFVLKRTLLEHLEMVIGPSELPCILCCCMRDSATEGAPEVGVIVTLGILRVIVVSSFSTAILEVIEQGGQQSVKSSRR